MKKNRILQTLVLLFFVFTANAQRGINYKAIIKDGEGAAIVNTAVTVQFTILESGTTEVYKEIHTPTTDANGIVIVNIGEGTVVSGVFNDIDWGSNPHYLKTEINTGSGLTDMGTTEFKTVPYALHALNSSGSVTELNDLSDAVVRNYNVFLGDGSGNSITQAIQNTAIGINALLNNTVGHYNTAIGFETLKSNTFGRYNTANGIQALENNVGGGYNTAIGSYTLKSNTEGDNNTALGLSALYSNTDGNLNTAIGNATLYNNTTGDGNIAIGSSALNENITGNNNTAVGYNAGPRESYYVNPFFGNPGYWVYTDNLTNTGAFGYNAKVTASNTIRIGNSSVTEIGGYASWSDLSDGRFKTNITSDVPGLDFIKLLKPVTFNWDLHKLDEFLGIADNDYTENPAMEEARLKKESRVYSGFIAQEVEEAANAIGYDFSAILKPENERSHYNLVYAEFVVPLVKAVQEQQIIINSLNDKLDKQEKNIQSLSAELDQLKALENRIRLIEDYQRVAEK